MCDTVFLLLFHDFDSCNFFKWDHVSFLYCCADQDFAAFSVFELLPLGCASGEFTFSSCANSGGRVAATGALVGYNEVMVQCLWKPNYLWLCLLQVALDLVLYQGA